MVVVVVLACGGGGAAAGPLSQQWQIQVERPQSVSVRLLVCIIMLNGSALGDAYHWLRLNNPFLHGYMHMVMAMNGTSTLSEDRPVAISGIRGSDDSTRTR